MRLKCFFLLAFSIFVATTPSYGSAHKSVLVEAILARIGTEAVSYSDLRRFHAVEKILFCAALRVKVVRGNESVKNILRRYVNEELVYLEAKNKLKNGSEQLQQAIRQIQSFPNCKARWSKLGRSYVQLWGSKERPMAGTGLLIRELEKRLSVDRYVKEKLSQNLVSWLKEANVKSQVKIFLE